MTQRRFRFMFSIYFIVFGIAITIFSSFIGYKLQMNSIDENVEQNAQEIAYIKKQITLSPIIDKVELLVIALAKNKSLEGFIENLDSHLKEEVTNLFLTIAMTDQYIMQVRYLDENGMEIARVDRNNKVDNPFVVDEDKLQDKSSRNYFTEIKKMHNHTIWYSNIDLNIEKGKIEIPFKPTIRIGTPIYVNNEFKGMIIINLLATEILNSISKSTGFDHFVIDKEGYFILHPNSEYSFSKYTNNNRKLYDEFPQEASLILNGEYKGKNFYSFPLTDIIKNDDEAKLILRPKQAYTEDLIHNNIKTTILVLFLSILISIPLAIYASLVPSKLQKALWHSNNELKRFAEIIDKFVITATTTKESVITSVSQAFVKASGYKKEELLHQQMSMIRHEDTPKKLFKDLWKTIREGKRWYSPIKNKRKDGTAYWLEQNIIPVKNEKGEITSYMSVGVDITAKQELERLSITDKLTNVFNRRKLDEELNKEFERAKRYNQSLSIMLMDIDFFKKVNDTYGHQTGDNVLQTVANLLKENIRKSDTLGRYGGEEFMIVCPQSHKEEVFLLAEKLRKRVESFVFDEVQTLTISIGVAMNDGDKLAQDIVKKADEALYQAKQEGRNKVIIAS